VLNLATRLKPVFLHDSAAFIPRLDADAVSTVPSGVEAPLHVTALWGWEADVDVVVLGLEAKADRLGVDLGVSLAKRPRPYPHLAAASFADHVKVSVLVVEEVPALLRAALQEAPYLAPSTARLGSSELSR
jgi:hypothetical protein